jgi:hypothetical protein
MNFLCIIPFHKGDAQLAEELLRWIIELGGCRKHRCLLVADASVHLNMTDALTTLAREAFGKATIAYVDDIKTSWPKASNQMFKHAAIHAAKWEHCPFFWCEPDCIPLRSSWLDEIANEYARCNKPFMGKLVSTDQHGMPALHMNGNAVYPHDVGLRLSTVLNGDQAWDIASADITVKDAFNTPLIHHFWGRFDLPPHFEDYRTRHSAENTLTLQNIPKKAVLFHRCKDGSLIRVLRQRFNNDAFTPLIHNAAGKQKTIAVNTD